jgi:hypothetical protein
MVLRAKRFRVHHRTAKSKPSAPWKPAVPVTNGPARAADESLPPDANPGLDGFK